MLDILDCLLGVLVLLHVISYITELKVEEIWLGAHLMAADS